MSARSETLAWLVQRVSAMVLALCVVVHLGVIVFAVRGGVMAAEIVDRVSGSIPWLAFYSVFILAAAAHAPIGLRTILGEATSLGRGATHAVMGIVSLGIILLGFRAVVGLYLLGV